MKPYFLLLLLHLVQHILLFRRHHSLLSLVFLKDLFLTLRFLRHGLRPVTITITLPTTNHSTSLLHIWTPHVRHSKNKPPKPTLVLVHGFGGEAKWQWEKQIPELTDDFELYVPDLVFFGKSTSDAPDRSVAFQAGCIVEAMRQLGVKKYSIVGLSYGGFVAYRMAAMEAAEAVDRVVVMTSGVCATATELRELVAREGRDVSEVLLPTTVEDLRELVRRSMHRPPWVPDFFLKDFIQVST